MPLFLITTCSLDYVYGVPQSILLIVFLLFIFVFVFNTTTVNFVD